MTGLRWNAIPSHSAIPAEKAQAGSTNLAAKSMKFPDVGKAMVISDIVWRKDATHVVTIPYPMTMEPGPPEHKSAMLERLSVGVLTICQCFSSSDEETAADVRSKRDDLGEGRSAWSSQIFFWGDVRGIAHMDLSRGQTPVIVCNRAFFIMSDDDFSNALVNDRGCGVGGRPFDISFLHDVSVTFSTTK